MLPPDGAVSMRAIRPLLAALAALVAGTFGTSACASTKTPRADPRAAIQAVVTANMERLDDRRDEATSITAQRRERRVRRAGEATPRHLGGDLVIDEVRKVAFAAASASAPPPPPPPAAGPALLLERRWLDAYEQNDANAMAAMLTEDFVITFPNGERNNKAQVLESVRRGAGPDSIRFWTQNVHAQVFGDTVILTGDVVSELRRSSGITRSTMRYTDTYVKRGGSWQVAASHLSDFPAPPGARKPGT